MKDNGAHDAISILVRISLTRIVWKKNFFKSKQTCSNTYCGPKLLGGGDKKISANIFWTYESFSSKRGICFLGISFLRFLKNIKLSWNLVLLYSFFCFLKKKRKKTFLELGNLAPRFLSIDVRKYLQNSIPFTVLNVLTNEDSTFQE